MRRIVVNIVRLMIAFISGFLISVLGDHLLNWPCGLPVLLALMLGTPGMLIVGTRGNRPMLGWLSTSYLIWLGLELPLLLRPQLMILTSSGCWASGCDPCSINPSACGPVQAPATFLDVFIGFVFGLFAMTIIVLWVVGIAAIVAGLREPQS